MIAADVSSSEAAYVAAVDYSSAEGGTAARWGALSDPAADRGRAMVAVSDQGLAFVRKDLARSPNLRYEVDFASAGTYHLYVRGRATGRLGASNAVHVGLDGTPLTGPFGLTNFDLGYHWNTAAYGQWTPVEVMVTAPGVHSIDIWMGQPGFALDALYITPDATERPGDRQPVSAAAFIDSIGVSTHLHYYDTAYGDFARVEGALAYLGVRHVRDMVSPVPGHLDRILALADRGIKFQAAIGRETPFEWQLDVISRNIRAFDAIEGPNETDNWPVPYQGKPFPASTQGLMADLYQAVKRSPILGPSGADLPVIQTSVGKKESYAKLGDLSAYADYANTHTYFNDGDPPASGIDDRISQAQTVSRQLAPFTTEAGYHTATNYRTWNVGVSEDVQARYALRLLLGQFSRGVKRTFLYELLDERPEPTLTKVEQHWGLFDPTGQPKPVATALRSLISILADDGPGTPPLDRLAYSLLGAPPTLNDLLLQKADGTFMLVLWNEVDSWDALLARAASPGTAEVSVRLPATAGVTIYDPLRNGTAPISTAEATALVNVAVPDHPIILHLK